MKRSFLILEDGCHHKSKSWILGHIGEAFSFAQGKFCDEGCPC
jgi:hypothetical protein